MPFQYRDHQGTLADSIETVQIFKTKQELVDYLQQSLDEFMPGKYNAANIRIDNYTYDDRIGWDTYIVILPGFGEYWVLLMRR